MTRELTAIIQEMSKVRAKKDELDEEEQVLWKRFYEIADDLAGEEQSFRFVEPSLEMFMAREMHQTTPRLDVDSLSKELSDSEWELIRVLQRVFDITRLEAAVALGQISKEVVEGHTERPPAVPHKKFGPASKKDLEGVTN